MNFGKPYWRTFEQGIQREWLLTNGIGGYSSSTIIGANTRRYHGLLIASLQPPVARQLILSQIDESIVIENEMYELHSYQTPDYTSKGHLHLQRFLLDPLPTYLYSIRDIIIEKKITMVYGQNTVAIVYKVKNGSQPMLLRLTPLVNYRDYHYNSRRSFMHFDKSQIPKGVKVRSGFAGSEFNLMISNGKFIPYENCYFYNMNYLAELERGLDPIEDHYIPGRFEMQILPYESKEFTVLGTFEKYDTDFNGTELIKMEEDRIGEIIKKSEVEDNFAIKLVKAADQFIVDRKSTNSKTIIAGYPWFTDWGRDTMIAFTGLTLVTKRFDDAKEILTTFSKHIKYGLMPNVFPDHGKEPAYNNVDGALWYFEAVNNYVEYTGDINFVAENIYHGLEEIIAAYREGTEFKIQMDDDFLITAGDETTQLTWMDAKIGNWVVTPRHGKAVEINALWYNALKIMAKISKAVSKPYKEFDELADNVMNSFNKVFWNEEKQCLYDVINRRIKDDKIRPNQLLALSLTFPVVVGERAKKIIEQIWGELYTSYGIRSLAPSEREYIGVYSGDHYSRDGAYHQGTAWPWLLGHFMKAIFRINGNSDKTIEDINSLIEPLKDHLNDACIGTISELFDGNEPLTPRGCFAQAWSIGEILHAYYEIVIRNKLKNT